MEDVVPIPVESCNDVAPGEGNCQTGAIGNECSLRAAVEFCVDKDLPVCAISLPTGTHSVTYGAINVTGDGTTLIKIYSSSDSCSTSSFASSFLTSSPGRAPAPQE